MLCGVLQEINGTFLIPIILDKHTSIGRSSDAGYQIDQSYIYVGEPSSEQRDIGPILGVGGSAVVAKIRCQRTDKEFALKTLKELNIAEWNDSTHPVRRELDALRRVKHVRLKCSCAYMFVKASVQEYIVPMFGYVTTRRTISMLLEFAPHGNLLDLMRVPGCKNEFLPLSERESERTMVQVCSALRYLHEDIKMVHRDVKPPNILVYNLHPIDVKLTDFGLAKILAHRSDILNEDSAVCGTPAFMPPEVCCRTPATTAIAYGYPMDSWSLGSPVNWLVDVKGPIVKESRTLTCSPEHRTFHVTVRMARQSVSMARRTHYHDSAEGAGGAVRMGTRTSYDAFGRIEASMALTEARPVMTMRDLIVGRASANLPFITIRGEYARHTGRWIHTTGFSPEETCLPPLTDIMLRASVAHGIESAYHN
ncbi:hypothetical protein NM688_g6051 [Phlebia brevispora]|uniref:Uncharacterized protein n=1 Tax=Phlebia brevispora TaxID=194682 RepID=A0ACC1SKF8_9APHY|nr:hypothetical protein NM688_g6051 [Phlebia brevispora]